MDNLVLKNLISIEKKLELIVSEKIAVSKNATFHEFYELWKNLDRDKAVIKMYSEFEENYIKFWTNEKYNKDLGKVFNMINFEHSGLYGGELEAYAVNFDDSTLTDLPFELTESKFKYLDNIASFPTFIIEPLNELTRRIQGKEDYFDDWDDLMDIYNLYEVTAMLLTNSVLDKLNFSEINKKLNFEYPFYFSFSEHDCGQPKLIFTVTKILPPITKRSLRP